MHRTEPHVAASHCIQGQRYGLTGLARACAATRRGRVTPFLHTQLSKPVDLPFDGVDERVLEKLVRPKVRCTLDCRNLVVAVFDRQRVADLALHLVDLVFAPVLVQQFGLRMSMGAGAWVLHRTLPMLPVQMRMLQQYNA